MIKLKTPTKIKATFKIITPMFISDAQQNASGISPQSFKGALRFWWRALAWSRIRSENNDDVTALKELHQQESLLFGKSVDGNSGGKGYITIKIRQTSLQKKAKDTNHPLLQGTHNSIRYLAYGVANHNGLLTRECVNEQQEFSVTILLDEDDKILEVKNTMIVMGLLGGLGSKVRKGFGSLLLKSLQYQQNKEIIRWNSPSNINSYIDCIKSVLPDVTTTSALPPFTAFTSQSSIYHLTEYNDYISVLRDYSAKMMMYRSWGRKSYNGEHQVLGNASEKNFINDHDWSKGERGRGQKFENFHPQRVIFGLPHNYGNLQVGRYLKGSKYGRRSSPLFFHVHQVGNSFVGIAMLLKATFLPVKEKILAGDKQINQKIEWDIIENKFIGNTKYFPDNNQILNNN